MRFQVLHACEYIYVIYRIACDIHWQLVKGYTIVASEKYPAENSEITKRPSAFGLGPFLRPRQNIFPVRTDLNGK